MKEVHVLRRFYAESFTLGEIHAGGPKWYSLELPWADNHPDVSCIPCGVYPAKRHTRNDGLPSLLLEGVPGRSEVEIHPGNTTKQTHGCILVGTGAYCSLPSAGVSGSDVAMEQLLKALDGDEEITVHVLNIGDLAHDRRPFDGKGEVETPTTPTTTTQEEPYG